MLKPKKGDLVNFYDFDIGEYSTGIVLSVDDYDHAPSQRGMKVPSVWILSGASTHIVPVKGEFWEVKVISRR
jgi:hypothetical protein